MQSLCDHDNLTIRRAFAKGRPLAVGPTVVKYPSHLS